MISEQLMVELENEKNRYMEVFCVFNNLPDKIKSDRYYVAVVAINGMNLAFASIELRNKKEIVLAAVANDGFSIPRASKELRADKDVVLTAVKTRGYALEFAAEYLKSDKEIVEAAMDRQIK